LQIDPNISVGDIMKEWPASIAVMLKLRMLCVGCPIARFHTIAEACGHHGIRERDFLRHLEIELAATATISHRLDAPPALEVDGHR